MNNTKKVLNKGFVQLVEVMGNDKSIAQTARVSYITTDDDWDKQFINSLMQNGHMSPFEHVVFKFHIKCPMFVARQWFRHKQSSFNEILRIGVPNCDFYIPAYFKTHYNKSCTLKNMSEKECNELYVKFENFYKWTHNFYKKLLRDHDLDRGQALAVLPMGIYTEFYWTVNVKSLMTFLNSRLNNQIHWEMQQYAKVLYEFFVEKTPGTAEAFYKKYKHNDKKAI